jgi:hypothetical protein
LEVSGEQLKRRWNEIESIRAEYRHCGLVKLAMVLRDFGSEYIHALECGRGRQQLTRLRHQSLRDRTGEMRLAARFVSKRVEDTEDSRAQTQREPHWRRGFMLRELKSLI